MEGDERPTLIKEKTVILNEKQTKTIHQVEKETKCASLQTELSLQLNYHDTVSYYIV